MSSHQTRFRSSPQRQLPLFQAAGRVFGPSPADLLIGDYRRARDAVRGWHDLDAAARAKLGQANRIPARYRRADQAAAMRQLNQVRAGMRANYRALEAAAAALMALGVAVEAV